MLGRILFFIFADIIISAISLLSSYFLRFNFNEIPDLYFSQIPTIFLWLVFIKIALIGSFRLYHIIWRLVSLSDITRLIKAHFIAYGLFVVLFLFDFEPINTMPKSVIFIDFALSLGLTAIFRMARRLYIESRISPVSNPTIFIGVDERIDYLIKKCRTGELDFTPVAIVDLDPETKRANGYISNLKVYNSTNLDEVVRNYGIISAIITRESHIEFKTIFEKLKSLDVKNIKVSSNFSQSPTDISIEDLLARHPKDLDLRAISEFIRGKRILITGAGGSIGSELSIQTRDFGANELILVEHSEFNLYQINEKLGGQINRNHLIDIKNREQLENVFKKYGKIDIVLHSAAYKHVPLCEENINSAVENNIVGSINVIDLSIKYGVDKVVIISTDKAVRPTNVMGATKRIVELYAQNIESGNTQIGAVRFGNVMGSSGSVIPKFKQLIENDQPITVTHPDITRYFMLISEACQLVLQTGTLSKGGEIFILDMGEPVKIVDLANKMKQIYGKEHLEIKFIGLRPGEKKYEELLISDSELKTQYESIFVARGTEYNISELKKDIERLLNANDEKKLIILSEIVPEFKHNRNG